MPARPPSRPCEDLYIYLMSGIVSEGDEAQLGDHFLGNWVEGGSSFLFFCRPAADPIHRLLLRRPDLRLEDEFHFTYEAWQDGDLDPIRIDPFWIVPPWQEGGPMPDRITILLDPGVVFGNCRHPTTQACLQAMALAARQRPLGRVLDLGTGTGILALAAARLGAERVVAVDLNPLCVKTAARNVEQNGLTDIIQVMEARAEEVLDDNADLIVANIHYEVIIRMLEDRPVNPDARLIISGLLRSQYRDVLHRLKRLAFHPVQEWDHEMTWHTVLADRRVGGDPGPNSHGGGPPPRMKIPL